MTGLTFLLSQDRLIVIVYKNFIVPNFDNPFLCDKRALNSGPFTPVVRHSLNLKACWKEKLNIYDHIRVILTLV